MHRYWLGIAFFLTCTAARAADLHVNITDQRGKPVGSAVVTLRPHESSDTGPVPTRAASLTKTINQFELAFVPYVEIFRPDDKVVFRNSDRTRHHVYSFSAVKSFEFMLGPGESTSPLEMDRSGVVAVGCNIHDSMITYLYITDAPWVGLSDDAGKASFAGLPAGTYTVRVWQPRLRPGKPDLVQSGVVVTPSEIRSLSFALSLLPDSRHQFDREHTQY